MNNAFNRSLKRFAEYPVGSRFQARYRQNHQSAQGVIRKLVTIMIGIVLLLSGLLMLVAPGPGIVVFILGGILLAEESFHAARIMDWSDVRIRQLLTWLKTTWDNANMPAKAAVLLVSLGILGGTSYLIYDWWQAHQYQVKKAVEDSPLSP